LDAATERSYAELRLRGRKGSWTEVVGNLAWLQKLKARKGFKFSISMTLNSVNYDEIERFIDLGLKYGAEPDVVLVANADETMEFQRNFLHFTEAQFDEMFVQVERSMKKAEEHQLHDTATALQILYQNLVVHRRSGNNLKVFAAKNYARRVLRRLPSNMQTPIRKVVQEVRIRLFEASSAKH